MSGNHSTTDSDTLGAGTATPPGRGKFDEWLDAKTTPELADLLTAAERARDEANDDLLFERKQVIELRQVVTELLACSDARDWSLFDADQVDEWRERAGLEDQ